MYKSEKGRLTPVGVQRVHDLRREGKTYQQIAEEVGVQRVHDLRREGKTYQQIAEELRVSLTTVYNVVKKRTHAR